MANLNIEFSNDFLSELLDSEFSDIATEALESTAPALKSSMQSHLRRVIKHPGDSDLVNSVKATKPKRTKTDAFIVNVGPTGKSKATYKAGKKKNRSYTVTNALKAVWLQYGRTGQPARPWLESATNDIEQQVLDKVQDVYNKKTGAGK